jgi:hypothetical protein
MSTTLIVLIAIWNGLLLAGFASVIFWRKQLPGWITGLDRWNRNHWEGAAREDETWRAFLEGHPELLEPESAASAERRQSEI